MAASENGISVSDIALTNFRTSLTNLTLLKNNRITERIDLRFRAEVYNVFNRVLFDNPGTAGDTIACFETTLLRIDQQSVLDYAPSGP